jgi:sec-independent protein translocase protein TatA
MGTLGVPEMMVIFLLALVLFGPKKLPELGRTIGKALTEFRRASNDLKSSFDREMQNLERETGSLRDVAHNAVGDLAKHLDYDPNFNDDHGDYTPPARAIPPAAINPSTVSASEVPGAESHGTSETASSETATTVVATLPPVEGTVPRSESTEPAQQHS